ncbi:NAD(P)/FAD-dependent oxidoreductase [Acidaminobacter sp. JC074]|uniref:NAD(P)/FAD-dependent oxidoreductase n=1 Tax=Acidaminobacter sp. JC074 TaxID=2530199 RepID=UPI001F106561|nr:NAD(P)/FAD-dependent oxidoreductase [Acidaminobacter sp. JC074]
MKYKHLFEPISIGNVEIKNRVMMAPMGSNYASHDGMITETYIEHYRKKAQGQVGLIITEDTTVSPNANYVFNTVGMYDDKFIEGYKELVDEVHKFGAKVGPQLIHPSFNAREAISGKRPVAASPIASRIYKEIPEELSIEQIEKIVEDFGDAARRVQLAGGDLVQIHAAHNHHLLGSFISALHNKRTDRYGGSLENRLRILVEVLENIKSKCGQDFPIIIRISGDENTEGGRSAAETQYILPVLEAAGASAFNVSFGTSNAFWDGIPPMGAPLACNADLAAEMKKAVAVPIITVGRVTTPLVAEGVLRMKKADMVAIGRGLLADQDFVKKAKEGRIDQIRTCAGCSQCIVCVAFDQPIKCMQNADIGRESYMDNTPASDQKKVLVVGGGPAGLEAARVAAVKGHDVTLVEKDSKLGGQVLIASVPPMKQELTGIVRFLEKAVISAGVKVELNKEMSAKEIQAFGADKVILATGGEPLIINSIPGIDNENVLDAWDILKGKIAPGQKSLVIGGGLVGCETADFIAHPYGDMSIGGNEVTIVEMRDHILMDDYTPQRHNLVMSLKDKEVALMTSTRVKEFLSDGILVEKNGQTMELRGYDSVVLAMGTRPNNKLASDLQDIGLDYTLVGDAVKARKILEAIAEGSEAGLAI